MASARWEPLGSLREDMGRLRRELNRLTEGVRVVPTEGPPAFPRVSILDASGCLQVEVDLPGLGLDDIAIEVREGLALVMAGSWPVAPAGPGTWYQDERPRGRFARTLVLPYPVDPERSECRLERGVLRLSLPRAVTARPHRVLLRPG